MKILDMGSVKGRNYLFIYEKKANLVYEVASDMRFSHEHANHELWIMKLPRASVLVTP
jgi:hypothetical protein